MVSLRVLLVGILAGALVGPAAALNLTLPGVAAGEDFNSLATATGSAMPAGWEFSESGAGANATYGAGNGSSSTGNTYSFGATGGTDRALGSLRTSTLGSMFGSVITNLTGELLTELTIEYVGEQWRLGATGRVDRLDFAYSLDATSIITGNWLELDALDFVGPVSAGVTGALDGNFVENRVLVSHTLTGLALAPGASLWVRWSDFEASGSDDGLAIDDFSVRGVAGVVQAVPETMSTGLMGALLTVLLVGLRRCRTTNAWQA
ncbi:MAG: hypothetical protein JNL92_12335 [Opitutaceae bacterium]|nr:hypothetical protein [Opitutaceae bacterium]